MKPNKLDLIDVWQAVTTEHLSPASDGLLYNQFYKFFKLPNGNLALILGGWAGSNSAHPLTKTTISILERTASGQFETATNKWLADSATNGVGAIVVADFNSDTIDDIFLPSNNEGSLVPYPGVAFISNNSGFIRIELPNSSLAHDATVSESGKRPIVLTGSLGGDNHPIYVFNGSGFDVVNANYSIQGNTVAVIPLADGSDHLTIRGDIGDSFSIDRTTNVYSWNRLDVEIFRGNGLTYENWQPIQTISPFLTTIPAYRDFQSAYGSGISHTYKILSDDLNSDGYQDLILGQSMWVNTYGADFPSVLQVLLNQGDSRFVDRTESLGPEIGFSYNEGDYSPIVFDFDNSGINSYIFSGGWQALTTDRRPFFVLLNDGSGKLRVGLDQEDMLSFLQDAKNLVTNSLLGGSWNLKLGPDELPIVNFLAIPERGDAINFLAQAKVFDSASGQIAYAIIDAGLTFNPVTSYLENITVSDRNNSSVLRTWAGNDSFYETNRSAGSTNIDGGLGLDRVWYSKNADSYQLSVGKNSTNLTGTYDRAESFVDRLTNIERLKFSDVSLALDLDGNAGRVAKLLGAVFGKTAVTNKEYVGIGLDLLDAGMSYTDLAALAVSVTGNSSPTDVCSLLWENVIGTPATSADIAPFKAMLDNSQLSIGQLTTLAADTSYNTTNIDLVGLASTGIEYI